MITKISCNGMSHNSNTKERYTKVRQFNIAEVILVLMKVIQEYYQ